MSAYEIIKISPTEHHIIKADTKELVSVYTRMSSAKRGLERLLAKESASASATGAAQATQGADAVAHPPASNTGGLKRHQLKIG